MTIVDKEVIGEESLIANEFSDLSLGIFLEKSFQQNIQQHGDAKWLTDVSTNKSIYYSQMVSSMRSVASGLRKRGFQTGDNVVVIGLNFVELPLMSMGAWRAGGSQACLSVNLSSDTIEMRMRELNNKFVLTDYDRASRIVEVVQRLDFVQEVFVIGDVAVTGCTLFDQLLQDSDDECPENLNDVDLDSMAWLAYTSGTTGISKGIVMTHRTVVAAFMHWKFLAHKNGHKFLFVNLMNITVGILVAMGLSLGHAELYCLSEFSENNLLSAIDRIKPSSVSLLPVHIAWICRYPQLDQYDLSSVKSVTVMGSLLNSFYERQIFNKLPNMLFLENIYGMTEAGIACRIRPVALSKWGELDKSKVIADRVFGSAGTVESNCKLKVVDVETGEKFGHNQIGEICLQTPFMLKEYLNNPQETANLIRNGWIHTGDQGFYDEDGNVFIVGRYKELIKYRNTHVVPNNVEKYLMTHPAVEDAAVIGLPDDVDGERPMAFIVLARGYNVDANDLISFTNEGVMDEEKLRGGIRFIDSIPRNGLGKIIRTELKKQLI